MTGGLFDGRAVLRELSRMDVDVRKRAWRADRLVIPDPLSEA
jgi:hypothetical protein